MVPALIIIRTPVAIGITALIIITSMAARAFAWFTETNPNPSAALIIHTETGWLACFLHKCTYAWSHGASAVPVVAPFGARP